MIESTAIGASLRASAWLSEHLVCPRDHAPLRSLGSGLECSHGHRYACVDGIPVLLLDDVRQTLWVADRSLERAQQTSDNDIGEGSGALGPDTIDPFVQDIVPATCGYLYKPVAGHLTRYPIPELRLPPGHGAPLLDIGCNWGRWSIAAARHGYLVVGIDPSLEAVLAARRVCRQLQIDAAFVVGDARFLPFASRSFAVGFSYSVIQHFSKPDARTAIHETGRVLQANGLAFIQMPNRFGLRSLYHLAKRGFGEGQLFDVRYWSPGELLRAFRDEIGPSTLSVDGFFGLGIQGTDLDLLPFRYRLVVRLSRQLTRASAMFPFLIPAADSLYVSARKNEP